MCEYQCYMRHRGPLSVGTSLRVFSYLKQGITFSCPAGKNRKIQIFAIKDRNRLRTVGKYQKSKYAHGHLISSICGNKYRQQCLAPQTFPRGVYLIGLIKSSTSSEDSTCDISYNDCNLYVIQVY